MSRNLKKVLIRVNSSSKVKKLNVLFSGRLFLVHIALLYAFIVNIQIKQLYIIVSIMRIHTDCAMNFIQWHKNVEKQIISIDNTILQILVSPSAYLTKEFNEIMKR